MACKNCCWWKPNTPEHNAELPHRLCNALGIETDDEFFCAKFTGPDSVQMNVPDHLLNGNMKDPNPNPVDGPTEILIISYGTPTLRVSNKIVSDLDWLKLSLRSIRRHCEGFQGITVAHPAHEAEMFEPLIKAFDVRLYAFVEPKGKGFLSHQIQMASADKIVPPSTRYVLLCDSDCIFKMTTRPEHYFWKDKPYQIIRSWESLTTEDPRRPGSKVVSDCLQWRQPTDAQLGIRSEIYGMCMNTGVFPVDFFQPYRNHIAKVQKKPFEQFMFEGRNEHPCTRMDWTAQNAWAYRFMKDRFHWFDVEKPPYPVDRKQAFWSHGGIDQNVMNQIEELLK